MNVPSAQLEKTLAGTRLVEATESAPLNKPWTRPAVLSKLDRDTISMNDHEDEADALEGWIVYAR